MTRIAHFELEFDAQGNLTDPSAERALADAVQKGRSHLFVLAHGWNNSPGTARHLFKAFFATIEAFVPETARPSVATVGVIWPSIRWPDEQAPGQTTGGAASVSAATSTDDAEVFAELRTVFSQPAEQTALDRLQQLLGEQPRDPASLHQFQTLLGELGDSTTRPTADEDDAERPIFRDDPEVVFDAFADLSPGSDTGGPADLGDAWKRIWSGAREALRAATYYTMKQRAGIVGQKGLGPLISRLPNAEVNVIGHSFGARLVSFALAGLPDTATDAASPVKSVFLVQGAFSHYSFASSLPFKQAGGALKGMQTRVDGPLVITHTDRDLALADFYPRASLIKGQDASTTNDLLARWGAMGWDGAQAVDAASAKIGPSGSPYAFVHGGFLNLDCNALIKDGPWPMGAHSDIIHSELGWVAAAAAGLATP